MLDLAVDPVAMTAKIIEFNPFGAPHGMGTGTVLFDLAKPHDADVLFGKAPFEFRAVMAPVPGVEKRIKGVWRAFLVQGGFMLA